MKKSDFMKTKDVKSYFKKIASTILALGILGSSVVGLSGCGVIFMANLSSKGLYTISQISSIDFKISDDNLAEIVENFDLTFDETDDTPKENNVVSDKRFAEILEVVKERADAFAKEYLTKETYLEKYGGNWNSVYNQFYRYNLGSGYRDFPIYGFNTYFKKNFKDVIKSNERLTEGMMYKIYATYKEVYFTNGEEYLKANYVQYKDLNQSQIETINEILYDICNQTFDDYFNQYKNKFSNYTSPFSFRTIGVSSYRNVLNVSGNPTTLDNVVQEYFDNMFWPKDMIYFDKTMQQYWIEIADETFLKELGYSYSDCLALTENPDLSFSQSK